MSKLRKKSEANTTTGPASPRCPARKPGRTAGQERTQEHYPGSHQPAQYGVKQPTRAAGAGIAPGRPNPAQVNRQACAPTARGQRPGKVGRGVKTRTSRGRKAANGPVHEPQRPQLQINVASVRVPGDAGPSPPNRVAAGATEEVVEGFSLVERLTRPTVEKCEEVFAQSVGVEKIVRPHHTPRRRPRLRGHLAADRQHGERRRPTPDFSHATAASGSAVVAINKRVGSSVMDVIIRPRCGRWPAVVRPLRGESRGEFPQGGWRQRGRRPGSRARNNTILRPMAQTIGTPADNQQSSPAKATAHAKTRAILPTSQGRG